MRHAPWCGRARRQILTILPERGRQRTLRNAPRITSGVTARSCGFTKAVAALGGTRENLSPLLAHEFLFCFEVGIGIQPRHEVAVPLKKARCEHAGTQL